MHAERIEPLGRSQWARALLVRGGALLACALLVSGLAGSTARVRASDEAVLPTAREASDELRSVSRKLEVAEGELAVARVQIDRANEVFKYSSRYQIPADLAASIYDVALSEGIEPDVGFRLVKIESNFKLKALSNAGAIGYTQIQPATAKFYEPGLTEDQLYQADVNLRLGFRFLKDLLNKYDQDWEIALLAYNRGPARVEAILQQGGDPQNGYADAVLKGTTREPKR
jgi:soluble lytic murein transglycosylase-like protein